MKILKNNAQLTALRTLGVGTTIFALVFGTFSPTALATLTVNIDGNGAESNNDGVIEVSQETTVVQQNELELQNDISSKADTGNNTVSENVGDVQVTTGDVSNNINVDNVTGVNYASGIGCSTCADGDLTIGVAGNGTSSDSTVDVSVLNANLVYQTNNGGIANDISSNLNTGNNTSSKNVGDGSIYTGDISANVELLNSYGINNYAYTPGEGGFGGTITVKGNGAYANVDITIALENLNEYLQSNSFWIFNDLDQDHNTGNNECKENVGDCEIITGDITSGIGVVNTGGGNNIGGITFPDPDDDNDPDDDEDDTDDDKSIIDKIIDKIIPQAIAAITVPTETESVLGAAQLPITGFGSMPTVLWGEVLVALYVIVVGLYLRNVFGRLERRYSVNEHK